MTEIESTGVELLAGRKPVLECIEQAPERVDAVWIQQGLRSRDLSLVMEACKRKGLRYQLAPQQHLDKLFAGRHQGVVARVFAQGFTDALSLVREVREAPLPVLLALDQVQDPNNVGTLARTLLGIGGGGILLPKHNAAGLGPGAAKAAAGALWKLPLAKVVNLGAALETAREGGLQICGAAMGEDSVPFYEFTPRFPAVLVLGGEDKGLRPGIRKKCDICLQIPLAGPMESLNEAGAMILGHWLGRFRS